MAIFSRRPADLPSDSGDDAVATDATPDTALPTGESADESAATTEDAPQVDISVSSFRGLGAQKPATPPPASAVKPRPERVPVETVPGVRDNVILREALAALGESPTPQEFADAARQVLQGHLFLRVKGDARALLAEGKPLGLAAVTVNGRPHTLAFSSGAAIQASIRADGDKGTSALGQPALTVLRNAIHGPAEGLVIDVASAPARLTLSRELIERMLAGIDEELTLKSLLAGDRTPKTAPAIAEALTRVPFWVAVNTSDDGSVRGVAEGRTEDGSRFLEVYSHPLEIVAMGRGDQPAPMTGAQLGAAFASDSGLTGILIDARGPWIRLTREDLAPVIALA
jgi:hypothetical protein